MNSKQARLSSLPRRTRSRLMLLYSLSFMLRTVVFSFLIAMWLLLSMRRTEVLVTSYGGLPLVIAVYASATVLSFLIMLLLSGLHAGTDKLFLSAAAGGSVRLSLLFSPCAPGFSCRALALRLVLGFFKGLWLTAAFLPVAGLTAITFMLKTDTALSINVYRVLVTGCALLLTAAIVFMRAVSARYAFSGLCLLCGASSVRCAVKTSARLSNGQIARSAVCTAPLLVKLSACALIFPAPFILSRLRFARAKQFVREAASEVTAIPPSKSEKPVVLELKFA